MSSTSQPKSTGKCICGKVTVTVTGKPKACFNCYCNLCRKRGNQISKLGCLLKPDQLEINDRSQLVSYTETGTQTGKPKHVYSCKTCHCPVYTDPEAGNGKIIAFSPCILDNGCENFMPGKGHFEEDVPAAWKDLIVHPAKL